MISVIRQNFLLCQNQFEVVYQASGILSYLNYSHRTNRHVKIRFLCVSLFIRFVCAWIDEKRKDKQKELFKSHTRKIIE